MNSEQEKPQPTQPDGPLSDPRKKQMPRQQESELLELGKTRKALEESEEKYRTLIQKIQAAVVVHGPDTEILMCNSKALELLGLTEDQILGKTAIDPDWYFFRDDGTRMPLEEYPANKVKATSGELRDYTVGIHRTVGDDVFVLVNADPVLSSSKEVTQIIVTFIDITERRKTKILAQQNEKLLLEAQQMAHIGNWWHDLRTDEIYWSDEFFNIIGLPPQKPTLELGVAIIHPDDLPKFLKDMEESAKGKMDNAQDFRIIRPDGEIRWIHNHWKRINDENGNEIKRIGTHQDITEQKLIEQERKDHVHFLEAMDKINRTIQGANNLEQMMSDVLDQVLSIFDCDRAYLSYPCDPNASSLQIPMERTKPEYPGIAPPGMEIPMEEGLRESFKRTLASNTPVIDAPETEKSLSEKTAEQYGFKSCMMMAIYPKIDRPWQFGMHQCSYQRRWTGQEERLFQEIGRRIEDALTSLLSYRTIQESEERYRQVFENSPVSLWEEDFSGIKIIFDDLQKKRIGDIDEYLKSHPEIVRQCAEQVKVLDVNSETLTLHGAKIKKELLTGLVRTFTPESLETFREELICLWNGKTEMRSDAVVKTLGGETRNVTVYFSVCPGYETTLAKVLVSLVDITERKRMNQEMVNTSRRLSEAQRLAHIGSWELDLINNKLSWSDEIYRIFEIDPEKFGATYEAFLETVHPEDRDAVDFAYTNSLKTKKPYSIDHRLLFPDGSIKYVHEQCRTDYEGDTAIRSIGTVQDITENKLAEHKLSAYRDHLEDLVQERTWELEAANKELEAFAYSVSHDLRAPLRHINGFLDLLKKNTESQLNEKGHHYIKTIIGAVNKMEQLIQDLLSFSRMGRQAMSPHQVNLNKTVRDVVQEIELYSEGRDINWNIGELPAVVCDSSMIRIVIMNLLSNAMKFTKLRKTASITIDSEIGENEVVISIRDNGIGFDPTYTDRLFGVFQRLHNTTEFEGTGAGLAMVRRIINRHGGRVWAEGKQNEGAAFYFSLPVMYREKTL